MESDCLFCKIVAGKIPCYKIYENDDVLAFLDLFPAAKGHVLMIPKKHATYLHEMSEEDAGKVFSNLPKVGKAVIDVLGVPAYNVMQNNGKESGQYVFHVHFHFLPRTEGDKLFKHAKSGPQLKPDEAKPMIESYVKALQ